MLKMLVGAGMFMLAMNGFCSEAELKLPELGGVTYKSLGGISGFQLMLIGILVCIIGLIFGLIQYNKIRNLPVHKSMLNVSTIIWETCKSYLIQQGKFLAILWALIGICMIYYFIFLQHMTVAKVIVILLTSILGILGSYGVAWFGMRINTHANSRSAFAALKGLPALRVLNIGDTKVTDEGMTHVAEMPALEDLNLWGGRLKAVTHGKPRNQAIK